MKNWAAILLIATLVIRSSNDGFVPGIIIGLILAILMLFIMNNSEAEEESQPPSDHNYYDPDKWHWPHN